MNLVTVALDLDNIVELTTSGDYIMYMHAELGNVHTHIIGE